MKTEGPWEREGVARRRVDVRRRAGGLAAVGLLALAGCADDGATPAAGADATGKGGAGSSGVLGAGAALHPCEGGRAACHTSADASAPPVCCEESDSCCRADLYGGSRSDVCWPRGKECPIACPDGTRCEDSRYCAFNAAELKYDCVNACEPQRACPATLCCGVGSQCVDGQCLLSDLVVDES